MQPSWQRTKIACYMGYITQAINCNLAPLLFIIFQNQFGISFEQIGRLILFNFCTQIVADVVATKYVDHIGYRASLMGALTMSTAGLVLLSFLPQIISSYAGLLIPVILYSFGSGLIEVLISPIVEAIPGDEKSAMMSLLHSFYCWGQMAVVLLSTLFIWRMGSEAWPWLPALWALVPLIDIFLFVRAPIGSTVEEGKAPMRVSDLFKSKFFFCAAVLMICSGSSELVVAQWSSLFAEKGLGVSKLMGDLLGPCLFAILMGATRALYGVKGSKIDIHKALIASGVLCVFCYGLIVFAPHPLLSLIGCALCGVSVALMWPGTLSFSAKRFPLGGTAMFGLLAVSGDIGGALGPWLSGVVSDAVQKLPMASEWAQKFSMSTDQFGLKCGILLGMVFPVVMLITLIYLYRSRNRA